MTPTVPARVALMVPPRNCGWSCCRRRWSSTTRRCSRPRWPGAIGDYAETRWRAPARASPSRSTVNWRPGLRAWPRRRADQQIERNARLARILARDPRHARADYLDLLEDGYFDAFARLLRELMLQIARVRPPTRSATDSADARPPHHPRPPDPARRRRPDDELRREGRGAPQDDRRRARRRPVPGDPRRPAPRCWRSTSCSTSSTSPPARRPVEIAGERDVLATAVHHALTDTIALLADPLRRLLARRCRPRRDRLRYQHPRQLLRLLRVIEIDATAPTPPGRGVRRMKAMTLRLNENRRRDPRPARPRGRAVPRGRPAPRAAPPRRSPPRLSPTSSTAPSSSTRTTRTPSASPLPT